MYRIPGSIDINGFGNPDMGWEKQGNAGDQHKENQKTYKGQFYESHFNSVSAEAG
jgi:hypothetical protein